VSLWPLYYTGIHTSFYPGVMHARLMIEGFMGAFIFGFLGTAGPRMLGAPPLTAGELAALLVLHLAVVGMHIAHLHGAADSLFLAALIMFGLMFAWRFQGRTDLPPPGFVLVLLGFLNAAVGAALLVASGIEGAPALGALGALLLHEGFVLHLVLGIGVFLLPRFLDLPRHEYPESRTPPPGWNIRALSAAATGGALFASFALEALFAAPRLAGVVRTAAATIYLLSELPLHRSGLPRLTITLCLRTALVVLTCGLLFPVLWPEQRVAGLHVVFIGGFTLITFTVATRVVLGHSGGSALFQTRLPFLVVTALLLLIGLALRVSGDFSPEARPALLNGASYLWMLAAAVWSWRVLPRVRRPEPD
jgi:uncharacterized protein involved in response to NO